MLPHDELIFFLALKVRCHLGLLIQAAAPLCIDCICRMTNLLCKKVCKEIHALRRLARSLDFRWGSNTSSADRVGGVFVIAGEEAGTVENSLCEI